MHRITRADHPRWGQDSHSPPVRGRGLASIIVGAVALGAPAVQADLLSSGSRPNVVVIMTDDLDETLLDTALEADLLPVIEDVFVNSGIHMTESFVTNSECCPSRATFLTGQYSHNHGVLTNSPPFAYFSFDDSATVATALSSAGYQTGFVGKYLNGYWGQNDLDGDGEIGADERRYVPPGWSYWQGLLDPSTYDVFGFYLLNSVSGNIEHYPDRYQTEVLAEKTVAFIDFVEAEDDEAPFFLWVSTLAPHAEESPETVECQIDTGFAVVDLPTIRPAPDHVGLASTIALPKTDAFNEDDISDKPVWLRDYVSRQLDSADVACVERTFRDKLESMLSVDDLLSDLLEGLERNGETGETVLVFTSDNGFIYGHHRLTRPSKTVAYEESIRVPLFIRDLSESTARSVSLAALNNDLLPTLTDLAGASPGLSVDGRSLLPALADPPPETWRVRFLVEHFYNRVVPTFAALRSVSASRYTYVEFKSGTGPAAIWPGCVPDFCEVYLLNQDPYQNVSQHEAGQIQTIVPTLQNFLRGLRGCGGGSCQVIEDL